MAGTHRTPIHVAIVAQYFWPEEVGAGVWIHQLATDLVARGHKVSMLTAFPNYPSGVVTLGYRGKMWMREQVDGVDVLRTWIYCTPKKDFRSRVLNFGSFCASSMFGALATIPDVFYCILPPLPLGVSVSMPAGIYRVPVVVNVQDIYPDIAITTGHLRNRRAIRFFQRMERWIYRHSDAIAVITESFKDNLTSKGVPPEKLRVIPNWADAESIRPAPKQNQLREELCPPGRMLVMYSGGMGHNTCLGTVIDAARNLRDEPVQFVLIGDGVKKAELQQQAENYGLGSVRFLPFLPLEQYAEALAASDLQLIALDTAATTASLPSKLLKIMSAGRPALALAGQESDLRRVLQEADCGVTVAPDSPQQVAEAIRGLGAAPERMSRMGENARAYLLANFDRRRCVDAIEDLLLSAVQGRRSRATGVATHDDRLAV